VRAYLSYAGLSYALNFFKTHDDVEVDLLLETRRGFLAIEFKCSKDWRSTWNTGLRRIGEELRGVRRIGVFAGTREQGADGIEIWPYQRFLRALWDGSLIQ
jgi:hypothetical protein